ncbi:predicted protein [Histoplasma capsulatum var. duboisii H88]|uniref:Predicted protein n=1 Tax=Ajellomyces capsulatus (strain H88) TaxID=544711 RepID=F0UER4_AJEC8|nr:predicted protein [Histoplasma capsulatum var. duboisii H88]
MSALSNDAYQTGITVRNRTRTLSVVLTRSSITTFFICNTISVASDGLQSLGELCEEKREDGAMKAKWEEGWLYMPSALWSTLIVLLRDRMVTMKDRIVHLIHS